MIEKIRESIKDIEFYNSINDLFINNSLNKLVIIDKSMIMKSFPNIIRKTKCSPLFKRSDISYKTKRPPKNNFPKYSRGSKKSTGKFCFSQCFFL